jgi:hypothetical protein
MMNGNDPNMDFTMTNQIGTGHTRKMKKKLKKLTRQLSG